MPSNAFTVGTGIKIPCHKLSTGCKFETVRKKTDLKILLTRLFCHSVKKEQLNKLSTFCED